MSGLLAALASLAAPLAARVLLAMGLSVVTVTGAAMVLTNLKQLVLGSLYGLPADAMALIGLGGGWHALGVTFGAMSFAATFYGLSQGVRFIGSSGV